jgi:hypothetical protein
MLTLLSCVHADVFCETARQPHVHQRQKLAQFQQLLCWARKAALTGLFQLLPLIHVPADSCAPAHLPPPLAPLQAHIWDSKKQVYLGGFDNEVAAAKAHDIMAIKTRGPRTLINFKLTVYEAVLPYLDDEDLNRVGGIQCFDQWFIRRLTEVLGGRAHEGEE